jgi:hypothetical protein
MAMRNSEGSLVCLITFVYVEWTRYGLAHTEQVRTPMNTVQEISISR